MENITQPLYQVYDTYLHDGEHNMPCIQASCCTIQPNSTELLLYLILPTIGSYFFCKWTTAYYQRQEEKKVKYSLAKMLFALSFLVSAQFAFYSWGVRMWMNPCSTFDLWLNGPEGATAMTMLVGGTNNIVFGFVDNAGLFIGLDYLEELFALFPGSDDANVVAGYGNTFSDFMGAFLGPFFAAMAISITGINDGPFWSNSVGIFIGCLLGVAIPKMLLSSSLQHGLNKISAKTVFLGNMSIEDLQDLLSHKTTVRMHHVKKTFNQIDNDGNQLLDKDEIKTYLEGAMGNDFNQEVFEKDIKTLFNVQYEGAGHGGADEYSLEEFTEIYVKMAKICLKERNEEKTEPSLSGKQDREMDELRQRLV